MLKQRLSLLTIVLLSFLLCSNKSGKRPSALGKEIANFSLRNIDGKTFSLNDDKTAKGFIVVFTCNHCPFAKLYTGRFNALDKKYKALGVPLLAINPMDTLVYEEESFEKMKKKAHTEKFSFPYLQDNLQTVAKAFNANHTPQAYVIWKENGKWLVKYSGAIDDNGQEPQKANPFVANAVNELLHSKPVSNPETLSFGCGINYR